MSLISKLIQEDIKKNPDLKDAYREQDEALEYAITVVNLRKELGWSQRDLAEALNKPQSTIARIENGETKPTLSTMEAIAEVTNKQLKIQYV
ncbi:helix-turn-helix domain-containing protein [Staphylococcus gallinarum]|uniref:helix-turn-helix domain-containing protein n=1 Tax=Staphylococcus gallinarum TaxID=1293 RepID=UPI001E433E4E|nr:helix-turn-helix domain-containing protein [Staphylococcus gallinarum]MCD8845226.1 helix-turn-helix domain-containing protein [Staphylococcus gallinarum]